MNSTLLLDILFLLCSAVLIVPIAQVLRLGAVPGFLIAGILVGPSGLGLIDSIHEISHLAEIGVVLLLFVIGIELKPSRLWLLRRYVFGLGTLQVVLSGLVIGTIAHMVFGLSIRSSILIGPALALSSTAFVLQILSENKSLQSPCGRASFAILLLQDLAVVPLLALIPLLVATELSLTADIGLALLQSLLIVTVVIIVGRYFLQPLLHRIARYGNADVFTASAVLIVLASAMATEHAGLSMAMGAFLAGLLMSDSAYRHQVVAELQPFRGLLLGLFFMSMGMSLNLSVFLQSPWLVLGLLLLLIVIKFVVLFPLAISFGLSLPGSVAVAAILAQAGEFSLVLFSLAFQTGLLDQQTFQLLLVIVLLSMIVTPLLSRYCHYANKNGAEPKSADITPSEEGVFSPIVLAGYGRVGHRIGEILTQAKIPFIAIDASASVVEAERQHGLPIYFGDIRKPEMLKSAGVEHAKIIIVTVNDPEAAENVVKALRRLYPEKLIYARGHSLRECRILKKIGANGVVSENFEASVELSRQVLTEMGISNENCSELLQQFRLTYQQQIND